MSSRGLRRAQKEREERELQQKLEAEEAEEDDGSPITQTKPSAFAMLGDQQDEEEEEDREEEDPAVAKRQGTDAGEETMSTHQAPPSAKRKKKRSKKAKATVASDAGVDDIEAALKTLSAQDAKKSGLPGYHQDIANELLLADSSVLAVDYHHLQVANEMRRVFGRAAFTADQEERADNRRRGPDGDHATLAEAVTGRLAHGGPGLPAMLRRRNIFVQGKEEWPRNTSNGLTMEVEESMASGVTTYRFVHSQQYKISQLTFAQCQATMDPTNMVNMLRFYPYHVATLLQVSEIAKQERDNATAGELLERALFAFGKALHPSFATSLAQGKARLDFRRPENREFYLASWRYIGNIGMRATWRTAYEWARLLLALDPKHDPYCVRLIIDQLALRSHQAKSFVELAESGMLQESWESLPNISYSTSLAKWMMDKKSADGAQALQQAVARFPWVAARLFQQLDIVKVPPCIWGKTASSERDILHSELYATLASDMWKLPEALAFLKETVSAIPNDAARDTAEHNTDPIDINEARYVILTDKPSLIGLLPRELTSRVDSMSDPLRPSDSMDESDLSSLSSPRTETADSLLRNDPRRFMEETLSLQRYFEHLVPDYANANVEGGLEIPEDAIERTIQESGLSIAEVRGRLRRLLEIPEDAIERTIQESGLSIAEVRGRLRRLLELRNALVLQPGGRVRGGGREMTMGEDGLARLTAGEGTLFGLSGEEAVRSEREIEEEMGLLQTAEEEEEVVDDLRELEDGEGASPDRRAGRGRRMDGGGRDG